MHPKLGKTNTIGERLRSASTSTPIISIKPSGKPTTGKSIENLVISKAPERPWRSGETSIGLISLLLPAPKL